MSLAETLRSHGIDTIEHAGSSFDDTSFADTSFYDTNFGGTCFDGTRASVVARPTSTTQVADAMRSAAEFGAIVVATGNGTKQTWGAPRRPSICCSTCPRWTRSSNTNPAISS